MGCYDSIYLENKIKCICGEELGDFQTKDLDSGMCSYVITKDNQFREDWLRYINGKEKAKKYNFIQNIGVGFYTSCEKCKRWHELYAIFIDGKLKKLIHDIYKKYGEKREKKRRNKLS